MDVSVIQVVYQTDVIVEQSLLTRHPLTTNGCDLLKLLYYVSRLLLNTVILIFLHSRKVT